MNHYLKKNQAKIIGAGGGGGDISISIPPPQPPPPAELQPPKLGAQQALASYSYSETVDMISDGPIDGLVNQNGQYVQGHRIFESIYFDNVPVKKTLDIKYTGESSVEKSDHYLTGAAANFSGLFYSNGVFNGQAFTGVVNCNATGEPLNFISQTGSAVLKKRSYFANHAEVNDPYLCLSFSPKAYSGNAGNIFNCPDPTLRSNQFEVTWSRNNIAKSLYKSIDLIQTVSDSPSSFGTDSVAMAKAKKLRYDYKSWIDVKNDVLPEYDDVLDDDYPIFAVKFNFGEPFSENESTDCGNLVATFSSPDNNSTVDGDFTIDDYTSTVLLDDISSHVFKPLEIDELVNFKKRGPMRYIDLTYASKSSATNVKLYGSVVVFGYKDENGPTKESVDAVSKFVERCCVVNFLNEKYNYNNVLAEARTGDDLQTPLSYFNKVYISKEYGTKLSGPFDTRGEIIRVQDFSDSKGFNIRGVYEFPLAGAITGEGSSDNRSAKNFSSYAGNSKASFEESAIPIAHVVDNNNVDRIYVTIGVRALTDLNQIDGSLTGIGTVSAGAKIPALVRFKLEWGLQDAFGREVSSSIQERIYQVVGVTDNPVLVDIGRSENESIISKYGFLAASTSTSIVDASTPIILPSPESGKKRFVRLTRTTYETTSVLMRREISLEKITEIISSPFSYPGSAIIGTKIDSRNISQIPPRSYDARLKRVFVPSNYYPLRPDGSDKRRYKTAEDFAAAASEDLQIYDGNWDGTFKESWTDNPAWILFDLLIDPEYGLGSFVDARQINVWELYKIGRFCDSVTKNGVFLGVDNLYGGKEPRYSTNIILADRIDVFQTINALANVFRGNIFYSNSEINFCDDRIKVPAYEFSNTNVKEGLFSYSNSRRDQEFNIVEVAYLDENDDFKSKVEYVENVENIRKKGVLKTTFDSFGVTSKSLAKRIGQHILYSTTSENESVSFAAGMDALLVKPGDLISINDELKTQSRNFGRIVNLDKDNGVVRINDQFNSGLFLNEITLVAPTGRKSWDELYGKAKYSGGITYQDIYSSETPQIQTFKISGFNNLDYGCDVYLMPATSISGISVSNIAQTGLAGTRNGLYSGSGTLNGYVNLRGIGGTSGYYVARSGTHWYLRSVSGNLAVTSGSSGLSYPTGSWATGVFSDYPITTNTNYAYLENVTIGSPYTISLSGVPKEIYKVTSIRESNVNEYEVAGIKFNSGKYAEIESAQNLDEFYGEFSFVQRGTTNQPNTTGNSYQLSSPNITGFSTGNFDNQGDVLDIFAGWQPVVGATDYSVNFIRPNGSKVSVTTTGVNYVFEDQNQMGFYRLLVAAKNQSLGYTSKTVASGLTIAASQTLSSPYISNIVLN